MSLGAVSLVQMQNCKKCATHVLHIALLCDWRKAATASSSVRGEECKDHESVMWRYHSYY